MLRDAEFFRSRISKLEGAADIGDHLITIISAKTVAEKPKTSETNQAKPETTPAGKSEESSDNS